MGVSSSIFGSPSRGMVVSCYKQCAYKFAWLLWRIAWATIIYSPVSYLLPQVILSWQYLNVCVYNQNHSGKTRRYWTKEICVQIQIENDYSHTPKLRTAAAQPQKQGRNLSSRGLLSQGPGSPPGSGRTTLAPQCHVRPGNRPRLTPSLESPCR